MHASQDTPFDQYILAMQTTADAPAASYNAATQASMRAKIDRAGKMKLHTLVAKLHAFCDTNDLDRMHFKEFDAEFLESRGFRLVFPRNDDEVVMGVSPAPERV